MLNKISTSFEKMIHLASTIPIQVQLGYNVRSVKSKSRKLEDLLVQANNQETNEASYSQSKSKIEENAASFDPFETISKTKVDQDVDQIAEFSEIDNVNQASSQDVESYIPQDKETQKFIDQSLVYRGYDPTPNKLVQRPKKDIVWGLGGELLKRKIRFFEKGQMPTAEEIIMYLEMEQAKDIELIDLHEECNRYDLARWGIILTGYSSRHMYRMAKNLHKALIDLEVQDIPNPPKLYGRRDDDWILVEYDEFMINMFTEESREDIDLENKWRNPLKDDDVEQEVLEDSKLRKKWAKQFKPMKYSW